MRLMVNVLLDKAASKDASMSTHLKDLQQDRCYRFIHLVLQSFMTFS